MMKDQSLKEPNLDLDINKKDITEEKIISDNKNNQNNMYPED